MTPFKKGLFLFCLPVFLLLSCETSQPAGSSSEKSLPPAASEAGAPVALARRSALSDWPVKGGLSSRQIKDCFAANSEATLKQYAIFLSPLSIQERKMLARMSALKPPIVTRTSVEKLRDIMRQKALLSSREASRNGISIERSVTPAVEDVLFGAFDCVFATVGPWRGSARYGEVAVILKDSVRKEGWATPWSGHSFLRWLRKKDVGESDPKADRVENNFGVNDDDRLLYLMFIIDGKDWPAALGYEAIVFLRAQEQLSEDRKNELIETLLNERDPEKFWDFFTGRHYGKGPMGYLEAKFPARVPAEYFESIVVPREHFDEVMSWPESEPFRGIVKAAE